MRRAWPLGVVVATVLVGGAPSAARGDEADATASPPARAPVVLLPPERIAAMKAELMADAAANARRSCPRPVLRGTPLAGAADADVVALLTPGPELAACLDLVQPLVQTVEREEWAAKPVAPPEGLATACRGLPEALSRAVRHEDACSPYLAGRRGLYRPDRLRQLAAAVILLARTEFAAGRPGAAVDLQMDFLRLTQDLGRGPGARLLASLPAAFRAVEVVQNGLRTAIDDGRIPAAELRRVSDLAGRLLATEPPFRDVLEGERLAFVLDMLLPALEPEGWTPPGGLDEDLGGGKRTDRMPGPVGFAPGQPEAVGWLAHDASLRALEDACREDALPAACSRAMASRIAQDAESGRSVVEEVLATAARSGNAVDETVRRRFVAMLGSISGTAFAQYVPRHTVRRSVLQMLRLQAEVALGAGPCERVEDFRDPRWAALLRDPADGTAMKVVRGEEPRTFEVRPSNAFAGPRGAGYHERWGWLRCPGGTGQGAGATPQDRTSRTGD